MAETAGFSRNSIVKGACGLEPLKLGSGFICSSSPSTRLSSSNRSSSLMALAPHPSPNSLPSSLPRVCPCRRSERRLTVDCRERGAEELSGGGEEVWKLNPSIPEDADNPVLLNVRSRSRASRGLARRNLFIIGEGGILVNLL